MKRSKDDHGQKMHEIDYSNANKGNHKITKLIANEVLLTQQETTCEDTLVDWSQQVYYNGETSFDINDVNKNAQSTNLRHSDVLDDSYRLKNKKTAKISTKKRDTKSQCSPISLFESMNFEIVNGATQRGRPMLIDSQNFTYNLKKVKINEIIWRCSVRNRYVECTTIIIQDKTQVHEDYALRNSLGTMPAFVSSAANNFSIVDHYLATYPWLFNVDPTDKWFKGPLKHIHPQPKASSLEKIKFTAQVKNMVHKDVNQSSNLILSRISAPQNVPCQAPTIYQMLPPNDSTLETNHFEGTNVEFAATNINQATSSQTVIVPVQNINYNQTPLPSPPNYGYNEGLNSCESNDNALLQSTILSYSGQNNINSQQSGTLNYRKDLLRAINRTRNSILSCNTMEFITSNSHTNSSFLYNESTVPITSKNSNSSVTNTTRTTQNIMASFKESPFFDDSESPGYYA